MRLRNIPEAKPYIQQSPYVIQTPCHYKGCWHSHFHKFDAIYIEIGCGKGQFIHTLAQKNPQSLFLGMDLYESVLYRAIKKYEDEMPDNLLFLNESAAHLSDIFEKGELDGIYLNFSDPWPKKRHAHRRLTSPLFLELYAKTLKTNGYIEQKTDNTDLFAYSLESFQATSDFTLVSHTFDLHHTKEMFENNILTEYEEKFSSMGHPICKLIAQLSK